MSSSEITDIVGMMEEEYNNIYSWWDVLEQVNPGICFNYLFTVI